MFNTEGLRRNNPADFFHFLWDGLDGFVSIAELQKAPGGKEYMQHTFYSWPQDLDKMVKHVNTRYTQVDIYVPPSVFNQPLPQKAQFKASNVSWVEFDDQPNFSGEKPTLRIQSSIPGREHWYYRMVTPITDVAELESYNKALAYTLGGDKGGWDANQLLRCIGTQNHKYADRPTVSVLAVYDISQPKNHLNEGFVEGPEHSVADLPLIMPDFTEILFKYSWPEKARLLLLQEQCAPGTRSDSLMALGYFCAEMGMENAEILVILLHADDKWGKFKTRADRITRLIEIIEIARKKYPSKSSHAQSKNGAVNSLIVAGWNDIINFDVDFDWVIGDMLLDNTTLVLAGKPDVGKTQVSTRFGINLALGRSEFLSYKITKQKKILLLSLELGIVPVKWLMSKMNQNLTPDERAVLQEKLIIVPAGQSWYLNEEAGKNNLDRLLQMVQPDGVIIDSFGKAVRGGISKEEPVHDMMSYLNYLNEAGTFVWGVHHLRKDSSGERKRDPDLDDLFGNQYIGAFARSAYALHSGDHGLELITLKQNFAAKPGHSIVIARTPDLDFHKVNEVTDQEKDEMSASKKSSKFFGE